MQPWAEDFIESSFKVLRAKSIYDWITAGVEVAQPCNYGKYDAVIGQVCVEYTCKHIEHEER